MRHLLVCLLLFPMTVFAQENKDARPPIRPPFTLKISPLGLINPIQQSFVVQADIPVYGRWGLDLGVGPVLNSLTYASKTGESYKGIRIQPAIKYYLKSQPGNYTYLSLSFKLYDISTNQYVQLLRQGGQYTEWISLHTRVETRGVSLQFGAQEYIGARKRWLIEPYIGIGIRQRTFTTKALPSDAELVNDQGIFELARKSGTYNGLDAMAGVRLGWVLGKRR